MPLGLRGKKKGAPKDQCELVRAEPRAPRAAQPEPPEPPERPPKPSLVFQAQLAHGGAAAGVEGFASIHELYAKIAQAFGIPPSEILYCTLNTPKLDMERLLGSQLGLEDSIFAHVKGIEKEVSVCKSEDALGLTITDNGVGYAFIKKIKDGSLMDSVKTVCVGDHIQEINGVNIVGWRHYDVAKMLKELKKEQLFSLKLIEPKKALEIQPRSRAGKTAVGSKTTGKGTLRLRSKGPATLEDLPSEADEKAIKQVDCLLDSYMGIRDNDLATTIFEAGKDKLNPDEFAVALDEALGDFAFPDEFVFDIWGVIGDAKQGRLQ
ncbi:PDZ domain-containing protein GIPC2 [Sminthopsis crassicaudata]|uniref:PDZ domain-containing protein GIPC2 n=1 Tax=Sminthopsis crassicaudata TaxID=9301 RepID=UPI003D681F30